MHIGFLTTEYGSFVSGGIGTCVRTLAHALVGQGHRVTVVGWGAPASFDDAGVRVRFIEESRIPRMGWFLNRKAAATLINQLAHDDGLDIVEAHDWTGPSAGMRLACPLVIRCHGSAVYFADLLHERVRLSVRLAERVALRGAASVTAVSAFTAGATSRLFDLEQPIGVIPNGIDLSRASTAVASTSWMAEEPGTILYLGTIVRKKGVLDLCRAFSLVAERDERARLRFVGKDSPDTKTGAASTWALCQELLGPRALTRVEYVGGVPHERVWDYMSKAALCVFPSYAEAMPMAWLEAMACGKAVVAYDIGWASEVIASGTSGVLVPPGDLNALASGIAALLNATDTARELGQQARRRIRSRFSVEHTAEASLAWYRRVLATHPA